MLVMLMKKCWQNKAHLIHFILFSICLQLFRMYAIYFWVTGLKNASVRKNKQNKDTV